MAAQRKMCKRQRDRVQGLVMELLELADPGTFEIHVVPCADDMVEVTLKDRWFQQPLRVDRQGRVLYPAGVEWAPRAGRVNGQLAIA